LIWEQGKGDGQSRRLGLLLLVEKRRLRLRSMEKIIAGYCTASRVEERRAEGKKERIGAAAAGVDWLLE
jgi:hypothetical protein